MYIFLVLFQYTVTVYIYIFFFFALTKPALFELQANFRGRAHDTYALVRYSGSQDRLTVSLSNLIGI